MDQQFEIELGGKKYGFKLQTTNVESHSLMSAHLASWTALRAMVRHALQLMVTQATSHPEEGW